MVRYLKTDAGLGVGSNGPAIDVPSIVRKDWEPMSFKLSEGDIEAAVVKVSEQTIKDIKEAQANVRASAVA
ncbi:hypothetical protein RJZ57_006650 [Blastomyces gilchristii]